MGNETVPKGKFRDAPLAAVAGRQHGVVSLAQLHGLGFSDGSVAKRVRAGRLHRVHRGVYAVGHPALSERGRWMAAVLSAGDGAALSHHAAAALWRVWTRRVAGIDVVAPGRRRPRPGVRVQRCRALDPRDVTRRHEIPVTTPARTLVDLAGC